MSKLKTIVALLLSLTVIGLCAVLPQLTGDLLQDGQAEILSTDMKTPPLNIKEDEPLSILEKLSLIATGQMITASSERPTVMTANEATQAAYKCLESYQAQGIIIQDIQYWYVRLVSPYLYFQFVDDSEEMVSNFFWHITMDAPDSTSSIEIILDDETGLLLSIYTYTSYGIPYAETDLIPLIDSIAAAFFKPLELTPDADDESYTEVTENEATTPSGNHIYSFSDPDLGTVRVMVRAAEYGFSVYPFYDK